MGDRTRRDGGPTIWAEGLTKSFGHVRALQGIDLEVNPGTVFGLLGPNGAGKTTTVRILTTLLRPDAGRATVAGFDVVRDAERLRHAIGLAGQYAAVDENLTGRENLEMVGRLYHLPRPEPRHRADQLLERFELASAAHRTVKTYSGGMRRRLDLAASLVGQPEVLFLDEPTTGLDPRGRLGMWDVIRELVSDGTTLLLTTQYMEEADRLCDRVGVIDGGKLIEVGTPDELKARVGGEVLAFRVTDPEKLEAASRELAAMGRAPTTDQESGAVTVPVGDAGPTFLVDVVRRLDAEGIAIWDLALRRPTLDDVFLSLTGHAAETADEEPAAGRRGRGSRREGGRP